LDALLRFYAPDVVWDMSRLGELGTFEGQVATRGFWEDWREAYDELAFELREVNDLGYGVVFAAVVQDGRLAGSTGRVRELQAWVIEWLDGLVARVTLYTDIDEGRTAAERLAESRG
jgi:ketosteroid isomerase-like protein